jgi:hypothetical protein
MPVRPGQLSIQKRRSLRPLEDQPANQFRSDAAAVSPAEIVSVEEYEVAVADLPSR